MTKRWSRLTQGTALAVLALFLAGQPAQAEPEWLTVKGYLKSQHILEDDTDLETQGFNKRTSQSYQVGLSANIELAEDIHAYAEGRAVKNLGSGGGEDPETGEANGVRDYAEFRQGWIEFSELGGVVPLSLKAGRQRIREDYSLWWNRDTDAVTLNYDSTLLNGFFGVAQNLAAYRTTGEDFSEDDEDILRVMAEGSWQYAYGHFAEARFMAGHDYSGMEDIGTLVRANNRDTSDARLFWSGVRLRGGFENWPMQGMTRPLSYRLDLMSVAGQDELQSSAASASPAFRTVTGSSERDVLGWAIDASVDVPLPVPADPLLTLGFAWGSGDDDTTDGDDGAFRETGLDSNYSKLGLSSGTLHNYGSVLRPDLSNLLVATAGIGVPLLNASDISFFYHRYWLDEKSGPLTASGIDAPLSGTDSDLGQAVDVLFDLNVSKELGLQGRGLDKIALKTTAGAFFPGDAYNPNDDETALRGIVELKIGF